VLIDIDRIKVEDRIRKDFGNLQELAEDIQKNGLINPPVITPDHVLIAGERRLRACQLLGYKQIEVRVITVKDYEHQLRLEISENENRKEFTFSERVEWARRLEQVERLKAKERQASVGSQNLGLKVENLPPLEIGKTRDKVAEQAGFGSGKNYEKAKFIIDHADPDIIQRLNEEKISINRAYEETKARLAAAEKAAREAESRAETESKRAAGLEKEVLRLKEQASKDAAEAGMLKNTIKELRQELDSLKKRGPEIVEKIVEKEVPPKDYLVVKEELRKKNEELLNLTRAQILLKDRYRVRDTLSTLLQSLGKYMKQVQMEVQKMPNDPEVYREVMSCAGILTQAAEEMKGWVAKEVAVDAYVISSAS